MIYHSALAPILSIFMVLFLAFGTLPAGVVVAADETGTFDLAVEAKAPLHIVPGAEYTINIAYTNTGTASSPAGTWVKASLPAGVTFVSAKNRDGDLLLPDDMDGSELSWNVGSVAAGACCNHIFITLAADGDLPEGTALTTFAAVGSDQAESNLANNTISVTSSVCFMAASTKTASAGHAKPGDVVTYTITLRLQNRSGQKEPAERIVELIDTLPPSHQVRFLGWDGQNAGTQDGEQLKWQGRVKAGEALTLQYRLGIEGDVAAGELVRNRARLVWSGDEMEIEPADVQVYLTENDHMFGPQGGQWQHQSGLTIEVPANALKEQTRFEFKPLADPTLPTDTTKRWRYSHQAFELNAFQFGEVHQFNQHIALTIHYSPSDVQGIDPKTLRLWYRNSPGEPWKIMGEPVKNQNGEVSFTTDHFTQFAMFGLPYEVNLPFLARR